MQAILTPKGSASPPFLPFIWLEAKFKFSSRGLELFVRKNCFIELASLNARKKGREETRQILFAIDKALDLTVLLQMPEAERDLFFSPFIYITIIIFIEFLRHGFTL